MQRAALLVALFLSLSAATAHAQDCPAGAGPLTPERITQDACQKAVDVFHYMAPELGTVMAGGNAVLGSGAALGRLGRFTVEARGTALFGSAPDLRTITAAVSGRTSTVLRVDKFTIVGPTAEGAVGLFPGFPFGVTNVLSLDALGSATYVPARDVGRVKVTLPHGALKFGYGARLGLIQESLVTPGIGLTYLQRNLPTLDLNLAAANASLSVNDVSVRTDSWRLVANKSLLTFGAALGVGLDTYRSGATVTVTANATPSTPVIAHQRLHRTTFFGDLYYNLFLLKFVLEGGAATGGNVTTFNTWSGKQPDAMRPFASLGIRFTF